MGRIICSSPYIIPVILKQTFLLDKISPSESLIRLFITFKNPLAINILTIV